MTDQTVSPRFLSLQAAALEYGFSVRTLRRYMADGALPGYRIGPRQIRVKREDLQALMVRIPTADAAS